MTLADPQFSRRPLGSNAPSKGPPPLIFLFSWLRWSACGVRARQLRCVAGAVQQGKRETGNGTRSRRRSVSASEKGQRGKSEGLKKSVHEIASDRGLVGKRRNQREPWSARLRDRRRDDVERQQHGAWGRRRGRERRGSSHTLHRPPPLLFWAPPLHSTLLASPPAPPSSQQEAVDVGVFSWPPLTLSVGVGRCRISQLAQARLNEITTPSTSAGRAATALLSSGFRVWIGFDGALSPSFFLCFSAPTSSVQVAAAASPQLVSARCYCHKPAAATARRGPARGGRGRDQDLESPGQSTWDVHR